jgi:signal transduction histidine kinase
VISLRSRLIVGCALVALVPLAVAMFLLSQRVETAVRTEAANRLDAALGGLKAELQSNAEQLDARLQILARDPVLKRLYLLKPSGSRDLNDYLAERRVLLGLDVLEVADERGIVVGYGADAATPRPLTIPSSAPILFDQKAVGVLSGGMALDAAFLGRLKRTAGLELVLRDGAGTVVAATLDAPEARTIPVLDRLDRVRVGNRAYVVRSAPLEFRGRALARITGLISTASADRTIAALRWTSLLLGILGLGIAILLGALWSTQISRPVEKLAAYSRQLAQGEWDEPLQVSSVPELSTLVQALDRMRLDLSVYRDKLVVSERHAAWSQMARKVAHEVKNPLTPIAISVADLKRSYELQRDDFPTILDQAVRTIGDEVEALKKMLQEFADFARLPAPTLAPTRVSEILTDLEALYRRDVDAGRLRIARPSPEVTASLDSGQIRQALVNLIQNGLEAIGLDGRVEVSASAGSGSLEIIVSDTGPGLSEEQEAQLFTPGFTTKAHGSGLGLTIVERIVTEHRGAISVESKPDSGTRIHLRLPLEGGA